MDFLKQVSIFSKWSLRDLECIAMNLKLKSYLPNEVVCQNDLQNQNLYIIQQGIVEVIPLINFWRAM